MVPIDREDEVGILRRATLMNRWRWRAEEKRLRRRGKASPFTVHLGELQMLHTVWRELRSDLGRPREPPMQVRRIARGIAERKCLAFLRENPS
jgi:hypothetical protein